MHTSRTVVCFNHSSFNGGKVVCDIISLSWMSWIRCLPLRSFGSWSTRTFVFRWKWIDFIIIIINLFFWTVWGTVKKSTFKTIESSTKSRISTVRRTFTYCRPFGPSAYQRTASSTNFVDVIWIFWTSTSNQSLSAPSSFCTRPTQWH